MLRQLCARSARESRYAVAKAVHLTVPPFLGPTLKSYPLSLTPKARPSDSRPKYTIHTDISGRTSQTTLSAVLDLLPDGSARAAFICTLQHPLTVLIGGQYCQIGPEQTNLLEALAGWRALRQLASLIRGSQVNYFSDNAEAARMIGGTSRPPGYRKKGEGRRQLRQLISAITQDLTSMRKEYDVIITSNWIPKAENEVAHLMSRCETPEQRKALLPAAMVAQVEEADRRMRDMGLGWVVASESIPHHQADPMGLLPLPKMLNCNSAAAPSDKLSKAPGHPMSEVLAILPYVPLSQLAIRHTYHIHTAVSRSGSVSTFAATLSTNAKVVDAFIFTVNHGTSGLRVGSTVRLFPPNKPILTKSYIQLFALEFWQDRLKGGDVTCFSDADMAVSLLQGKWPKSKALQRKLKARLETITVIKCAIKHVIQSFDMLVTYKYIDISKNQAVHKIIARYTDQERKDPLDGKVLTQIQAAEIRIVEMGMEGLVQPHPEIPPSLPILSAPISGRMHPCDPRLST